MAASERALSERDSERVGVELVEGEDARLSDARSFCTDLSTSCTGCARLDTSDCETKRNNNSNNVHNVVSAPCE